MPVINKKKQIPLGHGSWLIKKSLDEIGFKISIAIGKDLDRIGELFGVTRQVSKELNQIKRLGKEYIQISYKEIYQTISSIF